MWAVRGVDWESGLVVVESSPWLLPLKGSMVVVGTAAAAAAAAAAAVVLCWDVWLVVSPLNPLTTQFTTTNHSSTATAISLRERDV